MALLATGQDYQTATTGPTGAVTVPFDPESTGTFLATITRANRRIYVAQVAVTAGTGPFLSIQGTTLDDDMVIRRCEAAMESHPFPVCRSIAPNLARLAGVRIGKGWMAEVNRLIGGVEGCTHLREMLPTMATTAFQTMYGYRIQKAREKGLGRPKPNPGRPRHLNACHAFREDGEIVKKTFPEYYTGR